MFRFDLESRLIGESTVVLKEGGQVNGVVLHEGNSTIVKYTGGLSQTILGDRIKTV